MRGREFEEEMGSRERGMLVGIEVGGGSISERLDEW